MKRVWSVEELHESWSLTSSDMERMPDKHPAGRLGSAFSSRPTVAPTPPSIAAVLPA
jgi:hypothetical protein